MRITLDVDDDVLLAVREQARREHTTSGKVLSALARETLAGQHRSRSGDTNAVLGFRPLPSRGSTVSNALIDQLREYDD